LPADLAGRDLGQQLLEAVPVVGARPGAALVVVDRLDGGRRPAQGLRPAGQGVLAGRTLAIATDLLQG
jgi:hypothetical protein